LQDNSHSQAGEKLGPEFSTTSGTWRTFLSVVENSNPSCPHRARFSNTQPAHKKRGSARTARVPAWTAPSPLMPPHHPRRCVRSGSPPSACPVSPVSPPVNVRPQRDATPVWRERRAFSPYRRRVVVRFLRDGRADQKCGQPAFALPPIQQCVSSKLIAAVNTPERTMLRRNDSGLELRIRRASLRPRDPFPLTFARHLLCSSPCWQCQHAKLTVVGKQP
jgi:hypothetical protein